MVNYHNVCCCPLRFDHVINTVTDQCSRYGNLYSTDVCKLVLNGIPELGIDPLLSSGTTIIDSPLQAMFFDQINSSLQMNFYSSVPTELCHSSCCLKRHKFLRVSPM